MNPSETSDVLESDTSFLKFIIRNYFHAAPTPSQYLQLAGQLWVLHSSIQLQVDPSFSRNELSAIDFLSLLLSPMPYIVTFVCCKSFIWLRAISEVPTSKFFKRKEPSLSDYALKAYYIAMASLAFVIHLLLASFLVGIVVNPLLGLLSHTRMDELSETDFSEGFSLFIAPFIFVIFYQSISINIYPLFQEQKSPGDFLLRKLYLCVEDGAQPVGVGSQSVEDRSQSVGVGSQPVEDRSQSVGVGEQHVGDGVQAVIAQPVGETISDAGNRTTSGIPHVLPCYNARVLTHARAVTHAGMPHVLDSVNGLPRVRPTKP